MHSYRRRARSSGFTLVELLVVLALIVAVSAIAVPQLWGQYNQFRAKQSLTSFWQDVKKESQSYRKNGFNYVFDPQSSHSNELAARYDLEILENSDPIVIRADGFNKGGHIYLRIHTNQAIWDITVSTPDGSVTFRPHVSGF